MITEKQPDEAAERDQPLFVNQQEAMVLKFMVARCIRTLTGLKVTGDLIKIGPMKSVLLKLEKLENGSEDIRYFGEKNWKSWKP